MNALNTRKTTLSLAVLLLLASGAVMAAGENKLNTYGSVDSGSTPTANGSNSVNTDQSGTGSSNLISIYQVSSGDGTDAANQNQAGITGSNRLVQSGTSNTLLVGQVAGTITVPTGYSSPGWTVGTPTGVTDNIVSGTQTGTGAKATILQESSHNVAEIHQAGTPGSGNQSIEIIQKVGGTPTATATAIVSQSGNAAHTASVYQYGSTDTKRTVVATQSGSTANTLTYYQTGGITTNSTGHAGNGVTQTAGDTATIVQSGGILDVYQHAASGTVTVGAVTGTKTSATANSGDEGLVSGGLSIDQSGASETATVHFVNADTGSVTWAQTGHDTTGVLTQGTDATTGTATVVASITQSGNYQDATLLGTSSNTGYTATLATSGVAASHALVDAKY